MTEKGLFDTMYTQRAIRHFKPDPVPEHLIKKVVEAATKAPSGANQQLWAFIVVRDANQRAGIARLYQEAMTSQLGTNTLQDALKDPASSRTRRDAVNLVLNFASVPVHIVVCQKAGYAGPPGSSIYPAVQNLMLAAWGLGLGTVLTTVIQRREQELRKLLGIPPEWSVAALIPLGWPARAYGPPKRRPVEEVLFFDRWGAKL